MVPLVLVPAAIGYFNGVVALTTFFSGPSTEEIAFQRDGLVKASLVAHQWKLHYYELNPAAMSVDTAGDVWEDLQAVAVPEYARDQWEHFRPLFFQRVDYMVEQFETLLSTHASVLPVHVRHLISNTALQLKTDQTVYISVRRADVVLGDLLQSMFETPFKEIPRELGRLDAELRRIIDELPDGE